MGKRNKKRRGKKEAAAPSAASQEEESAAVAVGKEVEADAAAADVAKAADAEPPAAVMERNGGTTTDEGEANTASAPAPAADGGGAQDASAAESGPIEVEEKGVDAPEVPVADTNAALLETETAEDDDAPVFDDEPPAMDPSVLETSFIGDLVLGGESPQKAPTSHAHEDGGVANDEGVLGRGPSSEDKEEKPSSADAAEGEWVVVNEAEATMSSGGQRPTAASAARGEAVVDAGGGEEAKGNPIGRFFRKVVARTCCVKRARDMDPA